LLGTRVHYLDNVGYERLLAATPRLKKNHAIPPSHDVDKPGFVVGSILSESSATEIASSLAQAFYQFTNAAAKDSVPYEEHPLTIEH